MSRDRGQLHNLLFCSISILSFIYLKGFGRIQCLGEAGLGPRWARALLLPAHRAGTHQQATSCLSWYMSSPKSSSHGPRAHTSWPGNPSLSISHRLGTRTAVEAQGRHSPHSLHSQDGSDHQCPYVREPTWKSAAPQWGTGADHFLLG